MKICTKCRIEKPFSEFYKNRTSKDKLQTWCKSCLGRYRKKNRVTLSTSYKKYYQANREKEATRSKKYLVLHKEERVAYAKNYFQENREKVLASNRDFYWANQKEVTASHRHYYQKNREKMAVLHSRYRAAHKKERANYEKQRRRTNIQFKLKCNLRARLNRALKDNAKCGSAIRDLGCSINSLKLHLEGQFYNRADGAKMTWGNWGLHGWHIDHIQPLNNFNLGDRNDFLVACHWTNLQPLWAEENWKKNRVS